MIDASTRTYKVHLHTQRATVEGIESGGIAWIDLRDERAGDSVTMFVSLESAKKIRAELDKIIDALEAHEAAKLTGKATGERGGES